MSRRSALVILAILGFCTAAITWRYFKPFSDGGGGAKLEEYWPTQGWRYALPGELGLDAQRLQAMIGKISDEISTIDSVMIVRHGYVAVEEYFGTFNESDRHHVYSCTKSVVSTLIGIAIDRGEIKGVNERVLGLLSSYTPQSTSSWKMEMTLRDLLTMSSGIDARDDYPDNWLWLDRMLGAADAVQYCLDLDVAWAPGTRFKYTNANSHLLSAIIKERTGKATLQFARDNLFGPLGITDVSWRNDTLGLQWGFYGLHLRTRDMAKIGLLFLHGGEWDGRRIVSKTWVDEATRRKVGADLFPGYGYQWWVDEAGSYYCAMGYAGQFIYVFPKHDMVVVFTGRGQANYGNPGRMLSQYIIPSVTG